ncbi:MAG: hypothetical protein K1Y36_29605 [Blastocatellia bacterium]|nr:hypothetical protein [Blastocatellia bacterium]
MKTNLVLVTPKLAAEWLTTNSNNRPLSQPFVAELAHSLLTFTFRTTHQGIAFDEQGRLRDGQHRLTAIVQTGIAAEMLVSTGLTEADLEAIDDGRKRTARDVLTMLDQGDVTAFGTSIAREMLIGGHHLKEAAKRYKPGRQELVDFYLRHQEAVHYAERWLYCPRSAVGFGYVGAVIARAFYSVNRPKLDHFAEVLTSGLSKERDVSIIRLRNYILRVRSERKRGFELRDDVYAKTEKTLQEWVEGISSKSLIGAKEELFLLPQEVLPPLKPE